MRPEVAIRIVAVKGSKILIIENEIQNFAAYPGGRLEFGESIDECVKRELIEESGISDIQPTFKKILAINEFIYPKESKHKIGIFVLVDINKYEELEGVHNSDHSKAEKFTWKEISDLPQNLSPLEVTRAIQEDPSLEKTNLLHIVSRL